MRPLDPLAFLDSQKLRCRFQSQCLDVVLVDLHSVPFVAGKLPELVLQNMLEG